MAETIEQKLERLADWLRGWEVFDSESKPVDEVNQALYMAIDQLYDPKENVEILQLLGAAAPSLPSAEELARKFHDTYERLAPQVGYETRKESALAWEQVPEKNRTLMIATCSEILAALSSDKVSKEESAKRQK